MPDGEDGSQDIITRVGQLNWWKRIKARKLLVPESEDDLNGYDEFRKKTKSQFDDAALDGRSPANSTFGRQNWKEK